MKFRTFSGLKKLPASYVKLFSEAEKESFFWGLDWFELLANTTLDDGQEVRICALENGDDNPCAAMVLLPEKAPGNPFEPRMLSGFSNFYSMTYAPMLLGQGAQATDYLAELFTAISDNKLRFDMMRLGPMDEDSANYVRVRDAFSQAGLNVHPYFVCGNWYETVQDDSFEDYLKRRPSQLRNTFKRRGKALEKAGNSRYTLTTGLEGLDEAVNAYNQIYSASWKDSEQYPEFIPGLVRLAAQKGILRLGVIYIDDAPAAAQIWLLDGDSAVIYKLAYDEQFKKTSVGTILTMKLMEHVINCDGVREVDYGSGDDPYKKDWMTHRRERRGILAHNPRTIRGFVGGIAENAKRRLGRASAQSA